VTLTLYTLPIPAPALRRAHTWTGHGTHERRSAGPAVRGYPGPLDAALTGIGLVADDLYLLAHDDRTGMPLLPPRPLAGSAVIAPLPALESYISRWHSMSCSAPAS
jgi:hypothetical protein